MSAPIVEEPDEVTDDPASTPPDQGDDTTPPSPVDPIELRAARLSASATVRGALIAVVAGVVGAITAGYFSLVSIDRQIAAQNDVAAATFLRPQEQVAYSNLLSSELKLRQVESYATLLIIFQRTSGRFVYTTEQDKLLQDAYDKFNSDFATTTLIASTDAIGEATRMSNLHSEVANTLRLASSDAEVVAPGLGKTDMQLRASLSSQADQLADANVRFTAIARRDLGVK